MKNYKRTFAAMTAGLLALTPCFAAGMTAVAATLTVTDADTAAHTYNAYQIIKGEMKNEKLTELKWGNGIDPTLLINALNNNKTDLGIADDIAADATPQTVAEVLSTITDADKKNKLAKVIATAKSTSKTELTKSDTNYSSTNLDEGWYLILDETTSLNTADPDTVRSANILQITQDTAINTKHSLPTLDKVIVEDNAEIDANTAAIGDIITYNIKTKVPDTRGYAKYYFYVEDRLSNGLTFNPDSVSITIKDKDDSSIKNTLTKETDTNYTDDVGDYYVKNDGTIKFIFEDIIDRFSSYDVGDDIIISYTATLNQNAEIDRTIGNPNYAKLIYSNDPNNEDYGTPNPDTPDEPTTPSIVGETPEDKVNTYTTAIKIKKVDQNNDPLTGASFTLTGSKLNKVKKVSGTKYEVDDTNGTYWKLKTGAFTTINPNTTGLTEEQIAKYANDGHKYQKVEATASEVTATGTPLSITSTVDDDGYITFYGLNAGDYTLSETGTPDGYNKAADISFTITASNYDANGITWSRTGGIDDYDGTEKLFPVTVVNREGAILPSTGGIGTKLFYLFGGMLVVGSSVVLITKKRMSADDN